jgi:hypothetical protein
MSKINIINKTVAFAEHKNGFYATVETSLSREERTMADNFVKKTPDTLLEVVEVEFKIPLGFAEIKLPITAHAKNGGKTRKVAARERSAEARHVRWSAVLLQGGV